MATLMALVGTGLQVFSSIRQGQAARAEANYTAMMQQRQGAEKLAEAQREAIAQERKGEEAMSRTRAIAAASGAGGAETPSVAADLDELARRTEYNIAATTYGGREAQSSAQAQAALTRMGGKAAYQTGILTGVGQGLMGLYRIGRDTDFFGDKSNNYGFG